MEKKKQTKKRTEPMPAVSMIFGIEKIIHYCNKAIISGVVFCIIPDTNMANPPRPIRPSAKTYKSFFFNEMID
jgi:hypothetical protein